MRTRYLVTCNPGLEDITAEEVSGWIPESRIVEVRDKRGRVVFEAPLSETVLTRFYHMRSIHSAIVLFAEERVSLKRESLEEIRVIAENSGLSEYIPVGASFAVRAERIGEGHEYTSIDIARATADGIARAFEEKRGMQPLVRLNSPSIAVYAEVDGDIYRLGILIAGEKSLHRRGYRVYDHPAALKPTIAYGLLRLAGARDSSSILDPMCGGGTVAIEAALMFESPSEIYCNDKSPRHIEGAIANAMAARLTERIRFTVHDATRLEEVIRPGSIEYVASNPPYGIRMGDPQSVRRLYDHFLPSLYRVMAGGGRAAIITADSLYFEKSARRAGFRIVHARKVRHGDLWASVLVLEA